MAKKRDYSKDLYTLLYINLVVIVILLTIFNIQKLTTKKDFEVLGAATDNTYWEEMVVKHPTYRDAWVELGRMDKVEEIDPNYKP